MNDTINQIITVIGGGVLIILGIVIPQIAKTIGNYIGAKLELVQQKQGVEIYEANKALAIDLVKIIEERFRLGELVGSKADEFIALLLEKVPSLSEEEVKALRDLAVSSVDKEIGKYITTDAITVATPVVSTESVAKEITSQMDLAKSEIADLINR